MKLGLKRNFAAYLAQYEYLVHFRQQNRGSLLYLTIASQNLFLIPAPVLPKLVGKEFL